MNISVKVIGILFLIITLLLSGILIFMKGFLLSRTVLENVSECKPQFALRPDDHTHHHGNEGCWMHGRFKRAIILVVDALRFDFLAYNTSLTANDTFYLNKFQYVHNRLVKKPRNSRIYKFMADPPTTTMQRLKGLTTGSLPTFVDAGSNFQSYEVQEDNIINQIIKAEKRIKFFGDDTWLSLYPNHFYKSFGFPSFDVKDLHTVDNGVLQHLYPEMRRFDWDVIIAHFLGVDHCGHRFGPNHSAMAEKLTQMDRVIKNVTDLMRDDTVLFVLGDHGMTRSGDHGGDSDDELTAGLFVYSPAPLASFVQTKVDVVPQTDFVPTLSLLLGLPIPFANLGRVIPELFSHCPWWGTDSNEIRRRYHTLKALRLNVHQVDAYLSAYHELSDDLPSYQLHNLKERFEAAEIQIQALISKIFIENLSGNAVDDFVAVEKVYNSYLTDARKMCESVWAKFDMKMISLGLITIVAGIALTLYFFLVLEDGKGELPVSAGFVIAATLLHLVFLLVQLTLLPKTVPPVMGFVIGGIVIFMIFIITKEKVVGYISSSLSVENVAAFVITVLNCLVYFSNSFVVHEDAVLTFCLQTLLISLWFAIASESREKQTRNVESNRNSKKAKTQHHQDFLQIVTNPKFIALVLAITGMVLIKGSSYFKACREEQHSCEDSFFIKPLSSLESLHRNQRYLFSIVCLGVLMFGIRLWFKYYGNLNGTRLGTMCMSYAPWAGVIFTSLHWALQALPQNILDTIPQWQQVVMAQIVYGIIIISLISFVVSPLLVYTQFKASSAINLPCYSNKAHVIPTIYNQLKVHLYGSEEKPPVVFGLGSAYSASIIALTCIVTLFLGLLLSDGVSPSMLIAYLAFYITLELLSSVASIKRTKGKDLEERSSWCEIVILCLFSTMFFYNTGHQATIPNIKMEAAFTGFYGNFNSMILPGFLIWTNTFASHILFVLASPLIVFWPALSSTLVQWITKTKGNKQEASSWQGDFRLFNDGVRLRSRLLHLYCGILLFSSLKVLSAACAATVHRRHLMVWKIFAPRFIYEAAMFATISVTLIISYLFVLRVDAALSKFVKTLPSDSEKEK